MRTTTLRASLAGATVQNFIGIEKKKLSRYKEFGILVYNYIHVIPFLKKY